MWENFTFDGLGNLGRLAREIKYQKLKCKIVSRLVGRRQVKGLAAGAAGGRDEETYSKYAEGVQVKIDSEPQAVTAWMSRCVNG